MIPEAEPKATPDFLESNHEERILGKFSRPAREWPSPGAEGALVTKTWAPLGNIPGECPLWGGGGDR